MARQPRSGRGEEPEESGMDKHYDVLIVGGGQAAVPLAHALAAAGKRVGLAERKWLGGSCVNFGCTPTKAAIASARVAHLARHAARYGVVVPRVDVDFPAVLRRAQDIAKASRNHLRESLASSDNPRLISGHARFVGREDERGDERFRVAIGAHEVTAREVVLDTGTRSAIPPIEGLDRIDAIHSENWLAHQRLPARLAVIGGGYIGLEMAQFYRRMGSEVVVIERSARIAGHEDDDVADTLRHVLEGEGVRFLLRAGVRRFDRTADGVAIALEVDGRAQVLDASDVFLALGREPNTDALRLDAIGLATDDKGFIPVDPRLATRVPGVWAAGDIRGGPMFTHTSWDDYRILASQLAGDGSRTLDRIVPYAIFTDPELGRVGIGEREARERGLDVKIGRFEMAHSGKAVELGETVGFIKLIVDPQRERLLGATVLATEAAEIVHLYVELMNADAPYTAIERAIHIHPTLAEAAQSAVAAIH